MDMEGRGLITGDGELEDVAVEAEKLLALDVRKVVFHLETGSVYGTAIAFPQLARCSNYNKVFIALWIRAWLALALNLFLQLSLVVFVGEATQVMNPLGGMMHLCDFGATLDTCKGPDEVVDGCVGPGGTQFAPPRLYGYTQWAVQKFTKQALLDVLPDQEDAINTKVDPGEYGIENYWCRFVCLFLFTLSVLHEIVTCLRMALLLWSVPSSGKELAWITHKYDDRLRRNVAKYRVGGLLAGVSAQAGSVPLCLVGGHLAFDGHLGHFGRCPGCFVHELRPGCIDEMLYDAMTSAAATSIMKRLEQALEEEETAQEQAEDAGKVHPKQTFWCSIALIRQIIPARVVATLAVMAFYVSRYYWFKCKWSDQWQMWVSKDMYAPQGASYSLGDFVLNGFFKTVPHGSEPFWTMK
eukprot:CAMPEP_0114694850 /NCGR_PEP_ID=MMETSP0191-20121206/70668_1 /TAXON_ID=126664 /ORGANISM="Sorites sp." /LENGTH=410 /DNA_ID=CAMNT_0001990301 /DNA_START=38 /DNA_END=1270 /DNA_ORIENTATION=-